MVYYLRDKNNKNYFEVEVWNGKDGFDLSSHVYSFNYCSHVLYLEKSEMYYAAKTWLNCLKLLEEFRGWFWEIYVPQNFTKNIISDEVKAIKAIKEKLNLIAGMLQLNIIED